ncbi:hypothetical protein L7F22_024769 [Adiantum nelumboides]|nr:hypothetical protein [Adiantum nelumboides]
MGSPYTVEMHRGDAPTTVLLSEVAAKDGCLSGMLECVDKWVQKPLRLLSMLGKNASGDRRGSGAGEFVAGFVLGGLVFGALGYLFAPQVSSKLFGTKDGDTENSTSISDDDEGIAKTRRNLNEKIAKLNAAIDNVSAQLRADNGFTSADDNVTELEAAA